MTINDFECLDPREQVVVIFEAKKITERMENLIKVELFHFDNFFIEIKTSPSKKFKRTITTYALKDLPPEYARTLISIPVVVSD